MSFVNLTPDKYPDESILNNPGLTYGTRYFYFTFVATATSVNVFLSRNRYRNEEYITKLFTPTSSRSLLTTTNVSNIISPTTFMNGFIGLSTPNNYIYTNNTSTPNCKINNLIVGTTYILESRTTYNDNGTDFGIILRSNAISLELKYIQTSITPTIPIITPPQPPPPNGTIPSTPTNFTIVNIPAGVLLTWNEVANATEYHVYREDFMLANVTNPMHTDSYVVTDTKYSYKVLASNSYGESPLSVALSITPSIQFTNLIPDTRPNGLSITGELVRYYYHTFTAITPSIDVFVRSNGNLKEEVIIGLYNTANSSTNLLTTANVSNIDSNVSFTTHTIGTSIESAITVYGIRIITEGQYTNTTTIPNFRINNLTGDMNTVSANINTYILEIVSIKNDLDVNVQDFGIKCKNVSNNVHNGYNTQLIFNSISTTRSIPSPYIISYNFTSTSQQNYSNYIFPYLYVFQNINTIIQSIILTTNNARPAGSMTDMVVNFSVATLDSGTLGQSSITKWKVDNSRSPDFPYEQTITFNIDNFINGYFLDSSNINGNNILNGRTNIAYFNVLIHEMIHGFGMIYNSNFNNTTNNVGWSLFLTNVSDNNPWYLGPPMSMSMAVSMYKIYCRNPLIERIPIENNYGSGTILSHWDEGDTPTLSNESRYFNNIFHPALKYEIMTGFLNKNEYITGLTVGCLKDYGYNINMNSPYVIAYPYSLIPTNPNMSTSSYPYYILIR